MAQAQRKAGTFTANSQTIKLGDAHYEYASSFSVQLVGTSSMTIVAEGTMDGVTYSALQLRPWNSDTAVTSVTAVTGSAGYFIRADGMTDVQLRTTAYASGSTDVYAKPIEG